MVWAAETNIKGPKGDKGDQGASGAATCFMSDTAPVGKPPGSLWWETDTGYLYAYYDDGTSMQWVMVSPGSGGISQADADTRYVNVTGDTMSGDLKVAKSGPKITLDKADNVGANIFSTLGGLSRWQLNLANGIVESGGNAGSNFQLNRFNDAGTLLDTPFQITRSTGVADFAVKPTVAGQVWAAPFDALAYNGMQTNGAMSVSQERAYVTPVSVTTGANTIYVCDGWTLFYSISAGNVFSQVSQLALSGYGLALVISTTLTPTIAAGDVVGSQQKIEGYRVARLAWGTADAQPVTIGFWSNHVRTGQYSVALRNAPGTQYYVAPYTHAVSNVWQWNTITVPGSTAGTWTADNTTSLALTFTAACGATQTAPTANIWAAGSAFYAAPGQINGVAATSDVHRIAGVVILPGTEAPSAARAPLIMRPYDQELLTCQRYWEKIGAAAGSAYSATIAMLPLRYVAKRAVPTATLITAGNLFSGASALTITSLGALNNATLTDGELDVNVASGLTPGFGLTWRAGQINLDARL